MAAEPATKPARPLFSSGPTAKRPDFSGFDDPHGVLGRSHRAAVCKKRINKAMEDTLRILRCPEGYKAGIVPASDTGAVEMMIWALLGEREVDCLHFESFGNTWQKDLEGLGLKHNSYKAEYGKIPDTSAVKKENDLIFTWNGTTSGACMPNADWIPADREGLSICDATSAAFSIDLPWEKLDITTFSWQKALGGEAGHGLVVFSPRALERIRNAKAPRPLPKIFKILGKTADSVCAGDVINTISMMCLEDYLNCLQWVDSVGGLEGTIQRTRANYQKVKEFVDRTEWVEFLCGEEAHRSPTSVCLVVKNCDDVKALTKQMEQAGVAYDINSYKDAPAGIRIWCGATVDAVDVEKMLQWLDFFYTGAADKPADVPQSPQFSSGPCKKPPTFNWFKDEAGVCGRSHRAAVCKKRINKAMEDTLRILRCPEGYKAGIVPASDTGAVEMMIWALLGEREVDCLHFDTFGTTWANDLKSLDIKHNSYKAEYGKIPDTSAVKKENDLIFTWNGTTSGACMPNADWIPADREGLSICDATSAAFSIDLPWEKLDITTFSWQKALGGEAAHGMIVLSPRALERIRNAKAPRPLPKIFKILGKTADSVCAGDVINTISMMCLEDYLNCLQWVDSVGGLPGTVERTLQNFRKVKEFVDRTEWVEFLCGEEAHRSPTSVCLVVKGCEDVKKITKQMEQAGVAYDINSYRDAPAGIRIWCGATVDAVDVEKMLQWLEHFYNNETAKL